MKSWSFEVEYQQFLKSKWKTKCGIKCMHIVGKWHREKMCVSTKEQTNRDVFALVQNYCYNNTIDVLINVPIKNNYECWVRA